MKIFELRSIGKFIDTYKKYVKDPSLIILSFEDLCYFLVSELKVDNSGTYSFVLKDQYAKTNLNSMIIGWHPSLAELEDCVDFTVTQAPNKKATLFSFEDKDLGTSIHYVGFPDGRLITLSADAKEQNHFPELGLKPS